MEYDVIGDVHGQGAKLRALLAKLGYRIKDGAYRHPQGRMAVFLGDLIDRGPEQRETLDIVRRMTDAGTGRSILGNHELNAIGYATPDPRPGAPGASLRRHSEKNQKQHAEFLRQIGENSPEHREWVGWFKTLPPSLDLGGIRVVHAWWDDELVQWVEARYWDGAKMSEQFLQAYYDRGSPESRALKGLTQGLELSLPDGSFFLDAGGDKRTEVRTAWWRDDARTYRDTAIVPRGQEHVIPDLPLPDGHPPPPLSGAPVFVGHYWFHGEPVIQSPKLAVLDYGVGKNGPLVAYRWEGEPTLHNAGFVVAR